MRDGIRIKVKLYTLGRGDLTDMDDRAELSNRIEDFILADPLVKKLWEHAGPAFHISVKEEAGG
jgi:hypothetical protein